MKRQINIANHSKKALSQQTTKRYTLRNMSKKALQQNEIEIMKIQQSNVCQSQQWTNKCVICMGPYTQKIGKLQCGHNFCLDCIIQWWRHHKTCPYCRQEILFIHTKDNEILYFSDLPPQIKDKNEKFRCFCEICWGDIDEGEKMNICTFCRAVYWHSRCLPYKSASWYCSHCGQQQCLDVEINDQ